MPKHRADDIIQATRIVQSWRQQAPVPSWDYARSRAGGGKRATSKIIVIA